MIKVGNMSFMSLDEFIKEENSSFPKFIEAPVYSCDEEKELTETIIRVNNAKPGVIKYLCNEVNARYIQSLRHLTDKESVTLSNNTRLYNIVLDVVKNMGIHMPKIYSYNDEDTKQVLEKSDGEMMLISNNAFTMGTKDMLYVFVSDEIINNNKLDDEEIKALIGHEIGHALSNHLVYTEVFLTDNIDTSQYIPPENMAQIKKFYKNNYFSRCNEITADRAGLIACRNIEVMISMLKKISGKDGWKYKHSKMTHPNGYSRTEAIRYFANSFLYAKSIGLIDKHNPDIKEGLIQNQELSDIIKNLIQ